MQLSIEGTLYEQVGSITMDFTLIWLGENKIPLGSPVFLLDADQLRANVWAEKTQTIAYEITTRISPKVPREYVG
jgi:alanine racemase